MRTQAIILAAGKGTRMRSALPKVLHKVAGQPMLQHVQAAAEQAGCTAITLVVGPGDEGALVKKAATGSPLLVVQEQRLGTGHAVQCAHGSLQQGIEAVAVLYGDTPLLTAETITAMREALAADSAAAMVVLGFRPQDAAQYGRLVTKDGDLQEIVEYAEASDEQKAIGLCNAGIMLFRASTLGGLLGGLTNSNSKGEYYLTDCVALARAQGHRCLVVEAPEEDVLGVNSRVELAQAEGVLQQRLRRQAMLAGMTLVDPSSVFLSADTVFGRDCVIEPFVTIGSGVTMGDDVHIKAFSHLEKATIGSGCKVGPYARLRPGAVLAEDVHVGNFVEVKNSQLARGVKAGHLSYLGDADIGADTNVGAGTITCNYDGYSKARTVVGEGVFIGSDTALVAPVRVGSGSVIAAGSVVTEDADSDSLVFARSRQQNKSGGGLKYHQQRRNH